MSDGRHWDVIVIGTRAGGGTLAYRLARPASGSCSWSGAATCHESGTAIANALRVGDVTADRLN